MDIIQESPANTGVYISTYNCCLKKTVKFQKHRITAEKDFLFLTPNIHLISHDIKSIYKCHDISVYVFLAWAPSTPPPQINFKILLIAPGLAPEKSCRILTKFVLIAVLSAESHYDVIFTAGLHPSHYNAPCLWPWMCFATSVSLPYQCINCLTGFIVSFLDQAYAKHWKGGVELK